MSSAPRSSTTPTDVGRQTKLWLEMGLAVAVFVLGIAAQTAAIGVSRQLTMRQFEGILAASMLAGISGFIYGGLTLKEWRLRSEGPSDRKAWTVIFVVIAGLVAGSLFLAVVLCSGVLTVVAPSILILIWVPVLSVAWFRTRNARLSLVVGV
jgi:hypothetical protein